MSDDLALDDLPQPVSEGAVEPDALDTDGDNPNEMTDAQFGLLCDRMRENGWLGGPVITDADGLIADGEHRWRAAQEIGLAEVPVRQYDIDDATRRLWRQELNKIHGEHDRKRDALEYDMLLDAGYSEEVTALTEAAGEDLDELLAELRMDGSRKANYDYDPEHNVYFEDCVEGMCERLADDSVDCVITDPPYGVDWDTNSREKKNEFATVTGDKNLQQALELWREAATEMSRVLKPNGHIYTFTRWDVHREFEAVLEDAGLHVSNCLVWAKNVMGLGATENRKHMYRPKHEFVIYAHGSDPRDLEDNHGDVLEYSRLQGQDLFHPTQKPADLITSLMENSTDPSDTVLDPFMGSGTTAVAAIQNDRDYVGFEIDAENYREVIERRIGEAKRQREASVNQEEAEAD